MKMFVFVLKYVKVIV